MRALLSLSLLFSASATGACNCSDMKMNYNAGSEGSLRQQVASSAACCALCSADTKCNLWVFAPTEKKCWLKDNSNNGRSETDRITGGCSSTPPAPTPAPAPSAVTANVHFDTSQTIAEVAEGYVSYDMDWWLPHEGCSPEGWGPNANVLEVDLSSPKLRALTSALGPAYLRIGGSLDKEVIYADGISNRTCAQPINSSEHLHPSCLNASRWDQIHDFATSTNSKVVFGLSYPTKGGPDTGVW